MLALTVANIQGDGATNEERNNLCCVTNRLQLCRLRGAEAHVADDYRREGIDNAVWNGPA